MKINSRIYSIIKKLILTATILIMDPTGLYAQKYTVVIDAGHGGKDHGAIDNNIREKDINLKVALKVGEHLKKMNKDVKVVYTRDKDEYLTLQQRADKANNAKGDLFISIHTNSLDKKNPNRTSVEGVSTYTLGLHKAEDNMMVARRENAVMTLESDYGTTYNGFDPQSDESYIIFEMAQKGNMTQSVKFADQVQKQMSKMAGRKDRGVRQAGFWVLWATSMPSVLIELDFICNPNSAKYLGSDGGQDTMGKAIASAAAAYFKALAQHDKSRLTTQKETQREEIPSTDFSADTDGVYLADLPAGHTQTTNTVRTAPATISERTKKPASARRRRSDASREKSEREEYAEAIILQDLAYVETDPSPDSDPATSGTKIVSENTAPQTEKKNEKKNKKPQSKPIKGVAKPVASKVVASNATKAKPSEKPSNQPKQQPAKSKSTTPQKQVDANNSSTPTTAAKPSSSPVRMNKVSTEYKILLFVSDKNVRPNSPLFHGLTPITCSKRENEFHYYYGSSTNRNEMFKLLNEVQKLIPEAKLITVHNSKRVPN